MRRSPTACGRCGRGGPPLRPSRPRLPAEHWPLAALGLGGLADYGAYCLLGVPPYHWYYVSSTVALGVTGVFGLALLLRRVVPTGVPAAAHATPIIVVTVLTVGAVAS